MQRMNHYSEEAEKGIIGRVIVRPELVASIELKEDDFYYDKYRKLFSLIKSKFLKNETCDIVTIGESFVAKYGGNKYLVCAEIAELSSQSYYGAGAESEIKEKSQKRKLFNAIQTAIEMLNSKKSSDVFKMLSSLVVYDDKNSVTLQEAAMSVLNDLGDVLGGRAQTGYKSKLGSLHDVLGGYKNGKVYVIAARPGMGKTLLMLDEAIAIARSRNVMLFSMEMDAKELAQRAISAVSNINNQKIGNGTISQSEFEKVGEAINKLECNLNIYDVSGLSIEDIELKVRSEKMKNNLDIVFIDYLQIMGGITAKNTTQEVGVITRKLKSLARNMEIPIVLLSQLNRGVESRDDKVPRLSDLRDSGSIEQDADVVMMLYRDSYYRNKGDDPPIGEPADCLNIICKKFRGGAPFNAKVRFDGEHQKILDYDDKTKALFGIS